MKKKSLIIILIVLVVSLLSVTSICFADIRNDDYFYGEDIRFPLVEKNGFTFVGWRDKDTGKLYYTDNNTTMPDRNLRLQAVWKPSNTVGKFDSTGVYSDLMSSTVNGSKFDINNYPINLDGRLQIINFVEYCYSYDRDCLSNCQLYLYIYNPTVQNIDVDSLSNQIMLACAYNSDGTPKSYDKFSLKFCSKTEGEYENLFYKFRIVDRTSSDGKTLIERVKRDSRRYDLSGLELCSNGVTVDYPIGGTYVFSGFAGGYGSDINAPSDLVCSVNNLETVSLSPIQTYFRFRNGTTISQQVTSVYFGVPERFSTEYGKLQKIMAEWYEYKTSPILVTSDSNLYSALSPFIGVDIGAYNSNVGYQIYYNNGYYNDGSVFHYNCNNQFPDVGGVGICRSLSYLFSTNGLLVNDYTVSASKITEFSSAYSAKHTDNYLNIPNKKISRDLFRGKVEPNHIEGYNLVNEDADNLFDLKGAVSDFWNWWNVWFNQLETNNITGVTPIYLVKESDLNLSNVELSRQLLVAPSDVSAFREYCRVEFSAGRHPYLFRFSVSDYYNQNLRYRADQFIAQEQIDKLYVASETCFFNFDIIQLTYNKEGVYKVIPVVANPIDIIPDVTPPPKEPDLFARVWNEVVNWFNDLWNNYKQTVIIVLSVIGGLILLLIVSNLVTKFRQSSASRAQRDYYRKQNKRRRK